MPAGMPSWWDAVSSSSIVLRGKIVDVLFQHHHHHWMGDIADEIEVLRAIYSDTAFTLDTTSRDHTVFRFELCPSDQVGLLLLI
jgi:hypothetical protein